MIDLKEITKKLKALADENRIRILNLLYRKKDLCVCEIREVIGLSQPTVSSHLKLLENSNLVAYSKDGKWINYRIDTGIDKKIRQILDIMAEVLKVDKKIKEDAVKVDGIDRKRICRKQLDR